MMDVYRFFNSRDMAEYLKGLDYWFTLPAAAFIVYESRNATLEEKFSAWRELIDIMPDCSMEGRLNMKPIESFHKFLADYMALQERLVKMFSETDGAIYTYETYEKGFFTGDDDNGYSFAELGEYFTDPEKCREYYEMHEKDARKKLRHRVRYIKQYLMDQPEKNGAPRIIIEEDVSGNILSASESEMLSGYDFDIEYAFEGMWFDFPTPFHRGDILVNSSRRNAGFLGGVFVLNSISSWDADTLLREGFPEHSSLVKDVEKILDLIKKSGDTTDMSYSAYFLDEDDGLPRLYSENGFSYLDMECYREPLQGVYRMLKAVSSLLKGEISEELFANAYHLILIEEMSSRMRKRLERGFTKEGLEAAGLHG
ncbi:MAG: hypothetical protein LUC41_00645 [Clostridiales bacterium]|nr:hypothetical protein [Clostridiales bacterium]